VFRVRRPRTPESVPLSVDRAVGDRVADAVAAHHPRRLTRIGWLHALDAPVGGWATGEPPPRPGNALEVLVDGAEAFPRIAAELAGAESHVYLTGWYVSPAFELTREGEPTVFRNLLAKLAQRVDVRVLLWAGAPSRSSAPLAATRARWPRVFPRRAFAARSTAASGRCTA
jgi:phosphatidylserine/phosphatidylglycerophosphate/cardiolipin synthase-like enzyme